MVEILKCDNSIGKLLSSTFLWCCLLCYTRSVVLTCKSVVEILKCDHSNKSYYSKQYFPVVRFMLHVVFPLFTLWINFVSEYE